MYQSLDDFLEIENKPQSNTKMVLINETDGEGSFLINYFISRFIKDDFSICLISTSQTNSNYVNIANKTSINLKKFQEDNKFLQFNFIQHFAMKYLENPGNALDMQEVSSLIEQTFRQLNGNKKMIIIDDLSVFMSLGSTHMQVLQLVNRLKLLLEEAGHFLVVVSHSSERSGEECLTTLKDLMYQCDIYLSCEPLKTGYCKEVSGKITASKKYYEDMLYRPTRTKEAHYKLSDRNVSILPIGLSGAVL